MLTKEKNKFACSAVAITQMAAERWSGDPRHSQVTLESTGGESLLLTEKWTNILQNHFSLMGWELADLRVGTMMLF